MLDAVSPHNVHHVLHTAAAAAESVTQHNTQTNTHTNTPIPNHSYNSSQFITTQYKNDIEANERTNQPTTTHTNGT